MLVEEISQLLWDFGFRWHPDLQKKWIEGVAGMGMVAKLVDKQPQQSGLADSAMDFLAENNPDLLDVIKSGNPQDKQQLLKKLEKNFNDLEGLINSLKKEV